MAVNLSANIILQAQNVRQIAQQVRREFESKPINLHVQLSGAGGQGLGQLSRFSNQARSQIDSLNKALGQTISLQEEYTRSIGLSARRFSAFVVASAVILGITRALRAGTEEALKFDRELIKFAQVSGATKTQLKALGDTIGDISVDLGVSSNELARVAVKFKQAGLSINDVTVALKSVAQASLSPEFGDMISVTEGLIAAMNQFNKTAKEFGGILSSINSVSAQYAVESKDIIEAIKRTGGAFAAAGGDINEFIGLFTAVRDTTRESAATIATGLRTIFTRLQRTETVKELERLGIALRFTKKEAQELGNLNLVDQFVGQAEAFKRITEALGNIPTTDPRFVQIAETLGEVRQISKVIPLLTEAAKAQQAINLAKYASIPIEDAAAKAQEGTLQRLIKLREQFLKFSREILNDPSFKAFTHRLIDMASGFLSIFNAVKPLVPLLLTLASIKLARGIFAVPQIFGGPGLFSGPLGKGFGSALASKEVRRFSSGGRVTGPGRRGDTVPALLEEGEYVLPRDVVQRVGLGTLEKFRLAGVQKFAVGGVVGGGNPITNLLKESEANRITAERLAKQVENDKQAIAAYEDRVKQSIGRRQARITAIQKQNVPTSRENNIQGEIEQERLFSRPQALKSLRSQQRDFNIAGRLAQAGLSSQAGKAGTVANERLVQLLANPRAANVLSPEALDALQTKAAGGKFKKGQKALLAAEQVSSQEAEKSVVQRAQDIRTKSENKINSLRNEAAYLEEQRNNAVKQAIQVEKDSIAKIKAQSAKAVEAREKSIKQTEKAASFFGTKSAEQAKLAEQIPPGHAFLTSQIGKVTSAKIFAASPTLKAKKEAEIRQQTENDLAAGIERQALANKSTRSKYTAEEIKIAARDRAQRALATNEAINIETDSRGRSRATGLTSFGASVAPRFRDRFRGVGQGIINLATGKGSFPPLSAGVAVAGALGISGLANAVSPSQRPEDIQAAARGTGTSFKNRSAISGGLGGALTGGALGASLGSVIPGVGTAIGGAVGALVGGITGAVSAFQDAESQIRDVKLADALTDLNNQISNVASGALPGGNAVGAIDSIRRIRQSNSEQAAAATTGFFGTDTAGFVAQKGAADRSTLGQNIRGFIDILNKSAKDIGKDNPKSSLDDFTNILSAGNSKLNAELLNVIADLKGLPIDEVIRDFKKVAQDAQRQENNRAVNREIGKTISSFSLLSQSIEDAALKLQEFENKAALITNAFDNRTGVAVTPFGRGIGNLGTPDPSLFKKSLDLISSPFGKAGEGFKGEGLALDNVARQLPSILADALSQGPLGKDEGSYSSRITERLRRQLPDNETNRRIIGLVGSQASSISNEQFEDKIRTGDVAGIQKLLLDPLTEAFKSTGEIIAKELTNNAQKFVSGLSQANEQALQVIQQRFATNNARLDLQKIESQFTANRIGKRNSALDLISTEQLNNPFNQRQLDLTGRGGPAFGQLGNAFNPDIISQRLQSVQGQLRDKLAARDEALAKGNRGPTEEFSALEGEAQRLRQALSYLADASSRSAGAQEKLSKLEEDRAGRLGLAGKFLGSDSAGRQDVVRSFSLLKAANKTGLDALPIEGQQKVLSLLESNPNINSGIGNFGDIRERLIQGSAFGRLFGPTKDAKKEREGLEQQVVENFKAAVKAQEALEKDKQSNQDSFFQQLRSNFDRLFTFLQQNLNQAEITKLEGQKVELGAQQGKQKGLVEQKKLLESFGIKDQAGVNGFRENAPALQRFLSDGASVGKISEVRNKFSRLNVSGNSDIFSAAERAAEGRGLGDFLGNRKGRVTEVLTEKLQKLGFSEKDTGEILKRANTGFGSGGLGFSGVSGGFDKNELFNQLESAMIAIEDEKKKQFEEDPNTKKIRGGFGAEQLERLRGLGAEGQSNFFKALDSFKTAGSFEQLQVDIDSTSKSLGELNSKIKELQGNIAKPSSSTTGGGTIPSVPTPNSKTDPGFFIQPPPGSDKIDPGFLIQPKPGMGNIDPSFNIGPPESFKQPGLLPGFLQRPLDDFLQNPPKPPLRIKPVPMPQVVPSPNQNIDPGFFHLPKPGADKIDPGFLIPDQDEFLRAFQEFNTPAQQLTKAMEAIPTSISLEGNQTLNINLNGAEQLAALQDTFKDYINAQIQKGIKSLYNDKFAEAGPLG